MRKLLNTLYITNPGVYLGREGLNIVIRNDEEILHRSPIQNYENIICFNYTGMSPALMALCDEHNVSVCFMTRSGKLRGRLEGNIPGNVLLRREQFRIADDEEKSLMFAKNFINAKLYNSVKVIQRALRENRVDGDNEKMMIALEKMKTSKDRIKEARNSEELLGVEGDTSHSYFSVFDDMILKNKNEFKFDSRNRRPPLDPVNAMLSFTYALVRILVENALKTAGMDPYVGFFHKDRPGRAGLALDMMEELRAYMADRLVLSSINLGQINGCDFHIKENDAILFTEDGMKKFLTIWQNRCHETIIHPFLEERVEIGLIPYVQAMLLARTIRGDLEMYPPFFMN